MDDFYRTKMGARFFNKDFPELVENLAKLNSLLSELVDVAQSQNKLATKMLYDICPQCDNRLTSESIEGGRCTGCGTMVTQKS